MYRRGYDRNELMAKQVANLFGSAPEKLEDFVFASQVSQAEAKKFFIEQFRQQKWQKSGLIWWNILDGWPQISDAVVDYYFTAKLAYYIIRRSQQDVQLMIGEYRDWKHRLVAVNDTLRPVDGTYRVTAGTGRQAILEGSFSLAANGHAELADFEANPTVQETLHHRMAARRHTVLQPLCRRPRPVRAGRFPDLDVPRVDFAAAIRPALLTGIPGAAAAIVSLLPARLISGIRGTGTIRCARRMVRERKCSGCRFQKGPPAWRGRRIGRRPFPGGRLPHPDRAP